MCCIIKLSSRKYLLPTCSCFRYLPSRHTSIFFKDDIFLLDMPLYSLKTTNAILNASYKVGKASQSFPFLSHLEVTILYTRVQGHRTCTVWLHVVDKLIIPPPLSELHKYTHHALRLGEYICAIHLPGVEYYKNIYR